MNDSTEQAVTVGRVQEKPNLLYLRWALLLGMLVFAFAGVFYEMWLRWYPSWKYQDLSLYDRLVEGESYYTHGPLVPLVSLLIAFLLVRKTRIVIRPAPVLGGIVLGLFLLLYLVSVLAQVNFSAGFALIGMLCGIVLILWGRQALRRLWFPLAFLAFMVPLPEVTIYEIAFRMKMFAANVGVELANLAGVIVARNGNIVKIGTGLGQDPKTMVVANVCNGLRTMISLTAFGALYAYVCRLRGIWRVGLFCMTIPVALVANSLRILSLIVVADLTTVEFATGWYHDTSGILIFVVAFFLMFGLERFILWARKLVGRPAKVYPLFHDAQKTDESDPQWSRMTAQLAARRGTIMLVLLAVVMVLGGWYLDQPLPTTWNRNVAASALPRQLGSESQISQAGPDGRLDQATMAILQTEDYLVRTYTGPDIGRVNVTIVFSADNRKGTHPPDVCLAGSGEGIMDKTDVIVDGIPGRGSVPCRELIVQHGQGRSLFLYTYKSGSRYTNSFWAQQFTILYNGLIKRNASGALIRLSTEIHDSNRAEARRRCMTMMREVIPHLDRNMP